MSCAFISDQFGEISACTISDCLLSLDVMPNLAKKKNNNSFESDTHQAPTVCGYICI